MRWLHPFCAIVLVGTSTNAGKGVDSEMGSRRALVAFLTLISLCLVAAQSSCLSYPFLVSESSGFCVTTTSAVLIQSSVGFQLSSANEANVYNQPFPSVDPLNVQLLTTGLPMLYGGSVTLVAGTIYTLHTSVENAIVSVSQAIDIALISATPYVRVQAGYLNLFAMNVSSPQVITVFAGTGSASQSTLVWSTGTFQSLINASLWWSPSPDVNLTGAPRIPILQTVVSPLSSDKLYMLVYTPGEYLTVNALPLQFTPINTDALDRLPLIPERTPIATNTFISIGAMAWNVSFAGYSNGLAIAQAFPKSVSFGQTLCQYVILPGGRLLQQPQCLVNPSKYSGSVIPAIFNPNNFLFSPSNLMQAVPVPSHILVVLASYASVYDGPNPAIVCSASVTFLAPQNISGFSVSDQINDPLLKLYLLQSQDLQSIWEIEMTSSQYTLIMNGWVVQGDEVDTTQYSVSYWPATNFLFSPLGITTYVGTQSASLNPGPTAYAVHASVMGPLITANASALLPITVISIPPLTTVMVVANVEAGLPLFVTLNFSMAANMFIAGSLIDPHDCASYVSGGEALPQISQYQKTDFNVTGGGSQFYLLLESVALEPLRVTLQLTNYAVLEAGSTVHMNYNAITRNIIPQTFLIDYSSFGGFAREVYAIESSLNLSVVSRFLFNPSGFLAHQAPEDAKNFTLYNNYEFVSDGAYGILTIDIGPCVYADTGLPCGNVSKAIALSLEPFNVSVIPSNQLMSGSLSASNNHFFGQFSASVGAQIFVKGDPGLCWGWDYYNWHLHGLCEHFRNSFNLSQPAVNVPGANVTFCPATTPFVQSPSTIYAVYAMVVCVNSDLGCNFSIAGLSRSRTNQVVLPTEGSLAIIPQFAVMMPDNLGSALIGNVAILYQNASDTDDVLGDFNLIIYDEEWYLVEDVAFPKVNSLDSSHDTLAAGVGQAIRIYSFGYTSDSHACAGSFGQLIAMPLQGQFIVTTVSPYEVQVLFARQQFDYLLEEGAVFNFCDSGVDCQIRALEASGNSFVALVQAPTSVPISLQGVSLTGNLTTGFLDYEVLNPKLNALNNLIKTSKCLVATSQDAKWLSLEISEAGAGVFSYGPCVWYFNIVTGTARAINPASYGITDTLFGRSSSISIDGGWIAVSGSSQVYVFNSSASPITLLDSYPTYTQLGYHFNYTVAPDIVSTSPIVSLPPISNLHSYILGATTDLSPDLIVMVTDDPQSMDFGDSWGVAPLQASTKGTSWIPLLTEAEACPPGFFSNTSDLTPCIICSYGYYASSTGSETCTRCPEIAFCPGGTVRPMCNDTISEAQEFPFLIELDDPGAEEILIGALLLHIDGPYTSVIVAAMILMFIALMMLLIPKDCFGERFNVFQDKLRAGLQFFDNEPELEFEAEHLELVHVQSVIAGALKIILYIALVLGAAFAILFTVNYRICNPPEFQSWEESMGLENIYNINYVSKVTDVSLLAEELCLPNDQYNVIRSSQVTSRTGLPETAQNVLTYLTANQPGNVTVALIGYRTVVERPYQDVCSETIVSSVGCYTASADGSVSSCGANADLVCFYDEEENILTATYVLEDNRKTDLSMSFQFTFPLDVVSSNAIGHIYYPAQYNPDIDVSVHGDTVSTWDSWQRFTSDEWGQNPLQSVTFSAVYTPCVRQSELNNTLHHWFGFTRFDAQLPLPIPVTNTDPQNAAPLTVAFKLSTTGFVTYETESRNLINVVLVFTLGLAFIGLYHVVEVTSSILKLVVEVVEKVHHYWMEGNMRKRGDRRSVNLSLMEKGYEMQESLLGKSH